MNPALIPARATISNVLIHTPIERERLIRQANAQCTAFHVVRQRCVFTFRPQVQNRLNRTALCFLLPTPVRRQWRRGDLLKSVGSHCAKLHLHTHINLSGETSYRAPSRSYSLCKPVETNSINYTPAGRRPCPPPSVPQSRAFRVSG